jgi:hypothetical protein
MAHCTTCFDRQGVLVSTSDGDRLARCPACSGQSQFLQSEALYPSRQRATCEQHPVSSCYPDDLATVRS